MDDSSNNAQPPKRGRGRPKGSKNKAPALAVTPPATAPSSSPSPGRGRPTKLTPAVRDAFAAHIRRGVWLERAATLVGIDKGNLYDWLKRGQNEPSGPYRDFHHAYEKAQAEAESKLTGFVFDAAEKDAKIALSILERKFPAQWGRRQLIAVEAVQPAEKTTPFAFRVVGDEAQAFPLPDPQLPEPADAPSDGGTPDPQDPPPDAAA